MKSMKRIGILIIFLLPLGCASQQDLNTLKFELNTLETRQSKIEQAQKEQEKKISDKEKMKEQFLSQQADMQAQYTELQTQMLSFQGKLEELSASPRVDFKDLETRVKALEDALQTIKGQQAQVAAVATAKSQYDMGLEKFKAGKFDEALKAFETYLANNPEESLADNAHFWAGEALYSQGKYEDAILRYDVIIKHYPKSDKLPDALYKQGMAFIQLGDKEAGNLLLRRLVKDFPDSEPGKKAKKQLKMK
jgi:tol-pal system protein YbgF